MPEYLLECMRLLYKYEDGDRAMFILLGNYQLPFPVLELHSFDQLHTHRSATNASWTEQMHMKVCVIGFLPAAPLIANDNEFRSHG